MLLGEDFSEVGDIMRIYDQKWGLHGIYIYMKFCDFLGL
jgi:hypothetical protein